jgi:membrane-associated phospholipid phosphatase
VQITNGSRGRYGEAVTSGAVRRRGDAVARDIPAAAPVVSAGRPSWWWMAVAAVVTVAVGWNLLAGGWLGRVDLRISSVVAGWGLRHGHGYPFVWLVTQLGGRAFILAVLAVLVLWLGWRRRTLLPLVRVLVALALLTGVIYAFKYGMGRTAPAYPGSFFHRDGTSFPSGHVANAVLMWGLARWQAVEYGLLPPLQRLFWGLSVFGPVGAGLAMVALNFHWVTDAVVGAAVGVLLLGVVHTLDAAALSLWVRARAGREPA